MTQGDPLKPLQAPGSFVLGLGALSTLSWPGVHQTL